jgi:uncharacterized repeat protein (TIGR01451 family)
VTAAVPVSQPGVATPLGTAIPAGRDYLRVTPDRILAPVGSEVVLKAGVCSASGYLLANQRVEWLLSPGGAGQFVDLAERDQVSVMRWIWDTPRKVDNAYAITSASWVPVCLHRGTPDPSDDVQILKGDAWVSVTSATEGTSHVTAYTPAIDDWNLRRATATIYWVDAQWILPPPAVAEVGRPHVLTTTVARRTSGAPIAGWLVRYEVPGGVSLGYQDGNVVEVPTDANGRASVEVTPNGLGGGSTTVTITIVRPPQGGADASPRLEVGRGTTTITWSSGVSAPSVPAPFTPAPTTPFPGAPPSPGTSPLESTPPPALPSASPPTEPYTPPPEAPPPGRARLNVQISDPTPAQVAVGEFVSFNVTVTNSGDGTARDIVIKADFDRGLAHPEDRNNQFAIEYREMRDLPPGESETIPLTFRVTDGGTQCHRVTVSAEGADAVTASGCVTARQASLEVTATGPRMRTVGERAEFRAVVKNDGEVAATNVVIVAHCDPALNPVMTEGGHRRLPDGGIELRFESMEPAEQRTFTITADCVADATSACTKFLVTADGGVTRADEACVEILPLRSQPGATDPTAPSLRITITENTNPARAGQKVSLFVNVANAGQQVARNVVLSLLLPQGMIADTTQIQPAGAATVSPAAQGQRVDFTAVPELQPQAEQRYLIPVTVGQPGDVQVRAAVTATGLSDFIRAESNVIRIIPQ